MASDDANISRSIENVVQIIRSMKCTNEDKVDAYLTLFRYFQTNKQECIACFGKNTDSLFTVVQKHVQLDERAVVEAVLTFLGHAFSTEEIIKECQENTINDIYEVLCKILETSSEKSITIRTLWCFSHQIVPGQILKKFVKRIVAIFVKAYTDNTMKSETVNNEALRCLKRVSEQCPNEMKLYADVWLPHVFSLLATNVVKNREAALDVIEAAMEVLLEKQSYVQIFFTNELNNKEFSTKLNELFHNDAAPIHVLNTWACILRLLGESFFELNRVKVTNPLLKIAEKSFGSKVPEVTLALNNLWRALIDAVFTRPDEFGKRMEKIFLLPLRIRYKNDVISKESLKTQWHLICKIGGKINEYVEKAIIPLLDVYLKMPETNQANTSIDSTKGLYTPERSNRRKSAPVTPKTPKSPYCVTPKTKLLAAEMLVQLLTEPKDRQLSKSLKLEQFTGPRLNFVNITKNCKRFCTYLLNITETCAMKHENSVTQVWIALLLQVRQETETGATGKECWTPVLLILNDIIDRWLANSMVPLKILLLIPESILKMSITDLSSVENGSQMKNRDGLVTLYIVKLLLHKNFMDNQGYDQERFFILYERVIGVIFTSLTNQLDNTETIFDFLELANTYITIPDVCWRLWSTLTSLLQSYITRTNDVNQTGASNYNFQAVLKSLTHPLRFIDMSKLSEGTLNELLKVWKETFALFTRAVSLLSGVEINLALEQIFHLIKGTIVTNLIDCKSVHTLIKILAFAVKHVDHSNVNKIFTSRLTPTKVTKRMNNPLGNVTSYVTVIEECFTKCFELCPKEGKLVDMALIELLDVVETFYTGVESSIILVHSLHKLTSPLICLLDNNSKTSKFSSKVTVKTEKVLLQIFSTLESNNGLHFHSELLQTLEPIIIKTVQSARKPLRTRTGQFWNRTFGKSTELVYSTELKKTLTKYQAKLNLILPGGQPNKTSAFNEVSHSYMDDTAQFPDSIDPSAASPKLRTRSALHASPIKIHGSFIRSNGKESPKDSHKFGSPKNILGNFLASGTKHNSPKSPFSNSLKPTGKAVRRKLPINLNREDSCDFVEIKDSPGSKKKRLLTEHQKDRMRERTELPVMYNNLDQSQDALIRSYSQDLTQDTTFKLPEKPDHKLTGTSDDKHTGEKPLDESTRQSAHDDENMDQSAHSEQNNNLSNIAKKELLIESSKIHPASEVECKHDGHKIDMEEVEGSFSDFIPSSQTQEESLSQSKKRVSLLTSQLSTSIKEKDQSVKCSGSNPVKLNESLTASKDVTLASCDKTQNVTASSTSENITSHEKVSIAMESENSLFDAPFSNITSTLITDNMDAPLSFLKSALAKEKECDNKEVENTLPQNSEEDSDDILSQSILMQETSENKNSNDKSTAEVTTETDKNLTLLNMDAKIVVDKLPPTRNKRKRSLPARNTAEKKRKVSNKNDIENVSKENKVPSSKRKSLLFTNKPADEKVDPFSFEDKVEPSLVEKIAVPGKRGRPKRNKPKSVISSENPKTLKLTKFSVEKNDIEKTLPTPTVTVGTIISTKPTPQSVEKNDIEKMLPTPTITVGTIISTRPTPQLQDVTENKESTDDVGIVPESKLDEESVQLVDVSNKLDKPVIDLTNSENGTSDKVESDINNADTAKPWKESLSIKLKQVVSDIPSMSSPLPKTLVKNPFVNRSISSPTQTTFSFIPSPVASPATGILKKRLTGDVDSPSPPNKRRVSFQLPSGAIILPDDDLAKPFSNDDALSTSNSKIFTLLKKKKNKKKDKKPAVYPDLIKCTAPIEKILPSLTFSRGIGHLVRAQNILTVGDLSALSENQIEALPIRSPKVSTVRNALRTFSSHLSRDKPIPKSPLVICQPNDDSFMDSTTPTKDETSLVEEAALLLTPSRHHDVVKPTSLFHVELNSIPETSETISTVEISKESTMEKPQQDVVESTSTPTVVEVSSEPIIITSSTEEMVVDDVPVKKSSLNVNSSNETPSCKIPAHEAPSCATPISEVHSIDTTVKPTTELPIVVLNDTSKDKSVLTVTDFSCQTPEKVEKEKSVLEKLNEPFQLVGLTTKELFDVMSRLDELKTKAMHALRARVSDEEKK